MFLGLLVSINPQEILRDVPFPPRDICLRPAVEYRDLWISIGEYWKPGYVE